MPGSPDSELFRFTSLTLRARDCRGVSRQPVTFVACPTNLTQKNAQTASFDPEKRSVVVCIVSPLCNCRAAFLTLSHRTQRGLLFLLFRETSRNGTWHRKKQRILAFRAGREWLMTPLSELLWFVSFALRAGAMSGVVRRPVTLICLVDPSGEGLSGWPDSQLPLLLAQQT